MLAVCIVFSSCRLQLDRPVAQSVVSQGPLLESRCFCARITRLAGNYKKKSQLFRNFAFPRLKSDPKCLGEKFFGKRLFMDHKIELCKLPYKDCFRGNDFKSIAEFTELGLPLSLDLWLGLRSAARLAKRKYADLKVSSSEMYEGLRVGSNDPL